MSVLSRLREFYARVTSSQNPTRGQRIVYVESTIAGVRANPDTVLEISTVWACVNVVAKSVAQLPWRLHKLDGPDSSALAPGALDDLLNKRPNPEMSAFTFRETLIWHLELWGNAYAEIERDAGGRPVALWPIEPDRVTPRRRFDEARTLYYQVRNEYGPVTDLDPADVFHVHGPGWNGVEGYRTTAYAAQSLGLTMALERYGAAFFGNGAQIGGVILNKNTNLKDEGRRALLAEFNQRHQGPDKAHRWQYLDGNMDVKQTVAPPNAAQMIESRGFQVMEVCRWFGVPPHKVADLMRATNNNIEHQGIEFVTDGVLPRTVKFEQEADYKLIGPRLSQSRFTRLDVRSLQRGDLAGRSAFYKEMFDRGVYSPNDIRHEEGMNPLSDEEGGNKRFVMINMQTLESAGTPEPPGEPPDAGAGDGGATDPEPGGGSLGGGDPGQSGPPNGRASPTLTANRPRGAVCYNDDQPRDDHGRWTSGGATAEEKKAIDRYVGEDYVDINSALRAGRPLSGRYKDTSKVLDSVTKRSSLETDTTFYRGVGAEAVSAWSGKISVGSVIKDPAFVSVSSELSVARNFANSSRNNIVMRISASAGAHAADISHASETADHGEHLLSRDSTFRVTAWDAGSRTLSVSLQ